MITLVAKLKPSSPFYSVFDAGHCPVVSLKPEEVLLEGEPGPVPCLFLDVARMNPQQVKGLIHSMAQLHARNNPKLSEASAAAAFSLHLESGGRVPIRFSMIETALEKDPALSELARPFACKCGCGQPTEFPSELTSALREVIGMTVARITVALMRGVHISHYARRPGKLSIGISFGGVIGVDGPNVGSTIEFDVSDTYIDSDFVVAAEARRAEAVRFLASGGKSDLAQKIVESGT